MLFTTRLGRVCLFVDCAVRYYKRRFGCWRKERNSLWAIIDSILCAICMVIAITFHFSDYYGNLHLAASLLILGIALSAIVSPIIMRMSSTQKPYRREYILVVNAVVSSFIIGDTITMIVKSLAHEVISR